MSDTLGSNPSMSAIEVDLYLSSEAVPRAYQGVEIVRAVALDL